MPERAAENDDFRRRLYERYVSTFKDEITPTDDAALLPYWRWCEHRFLPLLQGLSRSARILELGCGPGHVLAFLQRQGFTRTEGIDVSAEQVQLARDRGLNARVADVFEVLGGAGADGPYDAVIAVDFVEHFSKSELLDLLPRIFDRLRDGGLLLLQTPNGQGLFARQIVYGDLTHLTILSTDSLRQLLRLVGFEDIQFFETGPIAATLKGTARVGIWKLIRWVANAIRWIETSKRQEVWTENLICTARRPASGVAGRVGG